MKTLCVLSLFFVLIGCTAVGMPPKPTVPPASISEFLELVESEDFHKIARDGKEIFTQGVYIPNHTTLFAQFPSSETERGHIRYVFYSFRGETSGGEVYLILEQDSGKVVEFNYFEASFE
jgi:hypothetical protein